MNSSLPLGKIDPEILEKLLSRYTSAGKRVLIGAGIGEKARSRARGRKDQWLGSVQGPHGTCLESGIAVYPM